MSAFRTGEMPGSLTDSRAWSVVFSVLASALLAATYMAARTGFANPLQPVAVVFGLATWILATPFVLHGVLQRYTKSITWASSESFLTLLALAAAAAAGWLAPKLGFSLLPFFGIIGAASAAWILFRQFRGSSRRAAFWFLAGTVVLTAWMAGVEWANGFLSPLFIENLILHGGSPHVDTWYLGSVANMLQLHGIPSVGLDGIPRLTYHYGSIWLFAQLASLTGISVLDFYQLGIPVIFIPLFFRAILTCANELQVGREADVVRSLANSPLLWCLLGMATVGALPAIALHSAGVWASGPVLSESYTLAIVLSLLLIGTVAVFSSTQGSSIGDTVFYLVILPLGLGAIGIVKVSQILLLAGLGGWLVLRYSLWKRPLVLVSLLLSAATLWIVYHRTMGPSRTGGLELFAFLRLLPAGWWAFFPLLHLFWSIVFVVLRLREEMIESWADVRAAISARKIVDVELIALLAIAGLLPGLLINIPNANAYYFSDFQRWVSLSLLIGSPGLMSMLSRSFTRRLTKRDASAKPFTRVLWTAALAPFALTMLFTSLSWGSRLVQDNLGTRREVQRLSAKLPAQGIARGIVTMVRRSVTGHPLAAAKDFEDQQLQPLANSADIQRVLANSPRYALVQSLQKVATLPRSVRARTILFIQPDVETFWNVLSHASCIYSPLAAPALAAAPLLAGVPPLCKFPTFVLGDGYPQTDHWSIASDASDYTVCEHAVSKGFHRVVRISPAESNQVVSRSFECDLSPNKGVSN